MCPLAILSALHHKHTHTHTHTHTYRPLWVGNYSDLFDQSTGSLAFCPTVKTAVCERERPVSPAVEYTALSYVDSVHRVNPTGIITQICSLTQLLEDGEKCDERK